MFVTAVRSEGPARIAIAGAVLLLHTILLLALLWTNFGQYSRPSLRERTIWLNLQAEIHTLASRKRALRQSRPDQATPSRSAQPSNIPVFSLPFEPNQKNVSGLHDQLFNCAPQNFADLDEAQRSRCRKLGAFPDYDANAMDYADHSDKVPGAKQWKRELARKKAPPLLPCGSSSGFNPIFTGACILENIANGFTFKKQYENQPAYFDKSGKTHVDNNGDPPPMYRDRDH